MCMMQAWRKNRVWCRKLNTFATALAIENKELTQLFLDSDRAPDACNVEGSKGDTPLAALT